MKLLTLIFLFNVSFSFAQSHFKNEILNGNWQGILKQNTETTTKNFAYWIKLSVKGDSIFGMARTEVANTEYFAVIDIKGIIKKNIIEFVEDYIIEQKPRPNFSWCLISGLLNYNEKDNSLAGNWTSESANCTPGSLLLYKSVKELNTTQTLKNTYSSFDELANKLKLKENVSGLKIILPKVYFETNSHKLNLESKEDVQKVYLLMIENPKLKVNFQGHTDAVGDDDLNMKLSYLRAKEIYDALIFKGIDGRRLSFEGYGKSRPIDNTNTSEGNFKNRRVEIEVTVTK